MTNRLPCILRRRWLSAIVVMSISSLGVLDCDHSENSAPAPSTPPPAAEQMPASCTMPEMVAARQKEENNRTVSVVLPHDEPFFPEGPGRLQFLTSCIVCHSLRYITMQPEFPQSVWTTEVHKMTKDYGAHLTLEQESEVVQYIMTIRGPGTSAGSMKAAQAGDKPR